MSIYEDKKQARIERLRSRADKKQAFASKNDFSLFGEAKSGLPLGQPILVGHHSEKRHRRHLERISGQVRKGYEAAAQADSLNDRADSAENRTAIDSDNPEATSLIEKKIKAIESNIEKSKRLNKLLKPFFLISVYEAIAHFKSLEDDDSNFLVSYLESRAHFYASKDTRLLSFSTTNDNAEIRRLKKRLRDLGGMQGFKSFVINDIKVELLNGQIQVDFPSKPSEEIRTKLKRSPLALKWSNFSKKWVRKHTPATASDYFVCSLKKVLESSQP